MVARDMGGVEVRSDRGIAVYKVISLPCHIFPAKVGMVVFNAAVNYRDDDVRGFLLLIPRFRAGDVAPPFRRSDRYYDNAIVWRTPSHWAPRAMFFYTGSATSISRKVLILGNYLFYVRARIQFKCGARDEGPMSGVWN